jgi:hypothetical protein
MNAQSLKAAAARTLAAATLIAAPVLIALGTAGMSHADTNLGNASATSSISHPAFPHQTNAPKPGTPEHHRHQWNRGW